MTNLVGQGMIDYLKEKGFRVKVRHLRLAEKTGRQLRMEAKFGVSRAALMEAMNYYAAPAYVLKARRDGISPHGGITIVQAEKDGNVFEARATCSPLDNFQRRTGLMRATGRLTSLMGR